GLNCGRISNCSFNTCAYAIRDSAGGNAASRITIFGNRFTGSTAQNLHFELATAILAFGNAYGTASNTITGPDSVDISGALVSQSVSEGQWTPTLIGSTRPGSHAYAKQTGLYNRVGNQVMIR